MKQKAPRQFLDSEKISKHLFCSICHEVFDNPTRMLCGHTFCYVCIEGWAIMTKLCPECKSSLKKRPPEKDLIAAHMVDDLMSKCSHLNCTWNGVYSTLKKHQRICEHRQRKAFDGTKEQNVVKVPDDEDIKEVVQLNKFGSKKIKQNQEEKNGPVFPDSESQQSLNLEPLIPKRLRSNNEEAQSHKSNSQHMNKSHISSSQSNYYLETNLYKMIKSNKNNQNNQYDKIECERIEKNHLDSPFEEEKQNRISRQFRDISFQDDDDIQLYPKTQTKNEDQNFNKNSKNFNEINLDQPEFFMYLNNNKSQPQNFYLLQRYQQQQRARKQKEQKLKSKWNIQHISSTSSRKVEDSDSDMSNPFDQPLPSNSCKYPIINDVIVLDSSDQSHFNFSKQSGQISVQMIANRQIQENLSQSRIFQPSNNEKQQISRQIKSLIEYRPQIEFNEKIQKRQRKNIDRKIDFFNT